MEKDTKTPKRTTTKTTAKKTGTNKNKDDKKKRFGDTLYDEIFIIILLLISVLVLLSLFTGVMGAFGRIVDGMLKGIFGAGSFVLPIVVMTFCMWMILSVERRFVVCKAVGMILFVIGISTLFQLLAEKAPVTGVTFMQKVSYFYRDASDLNGGVVGGVMGMWLKDSFGWGSYIITLVSIVISAMLCTGKSLFILIGEMIGYSREKKKVKDAKIKAKAEVIKEREEKRAEKEKVSEQKRLERMERRDRYKSIFNIILGGNEGASHQGLPFTEEELLEKDDIKEILEPEIEKVPIDISGINFEEPALIEVLGVADTMEESIPIFGMVEESSKTEEDVIFGMVEEAPKTEEDVIFGRVEEPSETTEDVIFGNVLQEDIPLVINEPIESIGQKLKEEPKTDVIKATEELITDDDEEEEIEYVFPPLDLLGQKPAAKVGETKSDMILNAKKLEETLKSFGVEAKVTQINKGPAVTRYELSPSQGVKVSKIVNLADDIALNLAATGIRIEAPIPGKAAVGIEVPNQETQSVYLRSVIENENFVKFPSKLAFALGEDIAGKAVVTDIGKMPHLLIAGATGSGKSVCINTLITSLLYKSSPEEVKLILIDPKVVELSVYNGIPHLLIPVVTDPKKAAGALNWAVREMLERYQRFAEHNVRDIKSYNAMKSEKDETDLMPQIVIVIDELADLMMAAPSEVEDSICRLAQMARAAGLHLIIATQRPSVDVITGVIKANIPSRLAFAVSSGIDSRTILDSIGAEKLLGKGDMLFCPIGMNKPVRIQGAFVTDKEVESIVNFVKQGRNHKYDKEMIDKITATAKTAAAGEESDEFFDQAVDLVVEKDKASVSMLQRQFRIGYNRAARLMEDLENRGIVSEEDSSKKRKVLLSAVQVREIRNTEQEGMNN